MEWMCFHKKKTEWSYTAEEALGMIQDHDTKECLPSEMDANPISSPLLWIQESIGHPIVLLKERENDNNGPQFGRMK
jgi:hypothetical protein